jgi:ABC-type amino acid transport substrate-binding protein
MKKIISVLLVCALVLLSGCAWYYDCVLDKSLESVLHTKVLRVPVLSDDVPMMYKNDVGEFEGLEVDIANAIATKLGVQVEWVEAPTSEWEALLVKNEVDMIFAIDDGANSVMDQYYPSAPYFQEKIAVAVKKNGTITSFNQINEMTIGVSEGAKLVGLQNDYTARSVVVYPTMANALLGLINDEVEGVLATNSVLGSYYKDNNDAEITVLEDKTIAIYSVVCLEDNKLGRAVIEVMQGYISDGTVNTVVEQWITLAD